VTRARLARAALRVTYGAAADAAALRQRAASDVRPGSEGNRNASAYTGPPKAITAARHTNADLVGR